MNVKWITRFDGDWGTHCNCCQHLATITIDLRNTYFRLCDEHHRELQQKLGRVAGLKEIMHKELTIIYQNNKPYGIRDETGYLFFFSKIQKFTGQEERYRQEIEEQFKLADFLLSALQARGGFAG